MDSKFISDRISILRTKKNVSEYRMSTDLGHSKSYIQSISSGRSMPSMSEFLYSCEYLGVTPKEFFDNSLGEPQLVQKLYELTRNMSEDNLNILTVPQYFSVVFQDYNLLVVPLGNNIASAASVIKLLCSIKVRLCR